jgi:hypothetical protein
MIYLSEVERKQRAMGIHNNFTFEYTIDLSGEVLIHPPHEYTEEMVCVAVAEFIGIFTATTFNKLNGFIGFDKINFKIIKR